MDIPWKEAHIEFKLGDIVGETDMLALRRFNSELLDWDLLSRVADYSIIMKNLDLPWNVEEMSKNPSIPWPTPKDIPHLDLHEVPIECTSHSIRCWNAAVTIQRQWHRSRIDPSYALCRRLVQTFIENFMKEIVSRNALTC